MTEQNFQDEEERQQYAAWRAGYQDPEAAARGAWIAAKHGWTIAHSLQADFAQLKEQMAAIGAGGVESLRKRAAIVSDAQIKAVFLANGFKIKEGMTDLKPYVYQAARALLATGVQTKADARDAERWMEMGKAIERACADLPEETEIIVWLQKDAGIVTLIDRDGNEHENFSCDHGFAGVMNEAIDAALATKEKQGGAV